MRKLNINVGQIFQSKSCGQFEVIEIESYRKMKVRFIDTGYETYAQGGQVTDGRISDKLSPTIYGVGILGDINFSVVGLKSYKIWHAMIQRCYSKPEKTRNRSRTYDDVTVCDDWKTYINFKEWFDVHYIEGYCLDKDLTVLGNKIYRPEACSFIPNEVNCLLLKSDKNRGRYPVGVHFDKESGKFASQINMRVNGKPKRKWLGYFSTPESAFNRYKEFKESWVKEVAKSSYKRKEISKTIYDNLMDYEVTPY